MGTTDGSQGLVLARNMLQSTPYVGSFAKISFFHWTCEFQVSRADGREGLTQ